jgi:phosphate-selective porin OprO/OprP
MRVRNLPLLILLIVFCLAALPCASRGAGFEIPEAAALQAPAPPPQGGEGAGPDTEQGYEKHFYIESADGNWKIEFGLLGQFAYRYTDFERFETESTFYVHRFRPNLSGHVFSKNLAYRMELEFGEGDAELLEAYIDWVNDPALSFRLGQFKVPYSREFLMYEGNLEFVDRSAATERFVARPDGYDIGVMVHGSAKDDVFQIAAGLFNGAGRNQFNDNKYPMFAARLVVNPNGYFCNDEGDLCNHEGVKSSFGGSFAFNRFGTTQANEFDEMRFGVDGAVKYKGFSTQGEFFYLTDDIRAIGVADHKEDGWYLQAGYFLKPFHHELAFRWSVIDPDRDVEDDWRSEYTWGYNCFLRAHRYKLQFDYSYLKNESLYPSLESKDHRFRAQATVWF